MEKIQTSASSSYLTNAHTCYTKSPEISVLHKLRSCKTLQELKQVHSTIIKTSISIQSLQPIFTKFISIFPTLSSSCDLNYAYSLFAKMPDPDITQYNAIIRCFSSTKNDRSSLMALSLFIELLEKSLVPDNYTYPFVFKACTELRALREGEEVHAQVIKNGLLSNLYVMNNLLRLYAVCGAIDRVKKVFDESSERDLVSWTMLIQGFVNMGYCKEGLNVFFEMCEANFRGDEMTMVVVLSACAKLGDLGLGRKIHKYMCDHKVSFDVFVGNALVDMYFKCGDSNYAHQVFKEMPVKNVVSWNTMISGLAQQGEFRKALNVFRDMQRKGVKPDSVTLVGVLNSCANLGGLEFGNWVHAYLDRNHIRADGIIGNAFIDMYAKSGSIDKAFGVFMSMKCKDIYTFTSMIVGLAMNGKGEKALEVFSEMPKMGIEPNEVTYVGVLMACSHVGLVEDGRKHFANMLRVYNLKPQIEHYSCMVDLLGRAGLINEAEQFIREMPIEPDSFVWGALLGACRIHGNVELGKSIMEILETIESERGDAYVLMSNIYSSSDRWGEAYKLRKTMNELNMKKSPGCSSIELNGVVYEFRKGDKAHPKAKDIYALLNELNSQLRNVTHLAEV